MREQNHCIVTTYGMDGACSAAMLLQRFPKAEIVITSARRIGDSLEDLRTQDMPPHQIHICGVGISDCLDRIVEQLHELVRMKRTIWWYCGRQYLDKYQSILEKFCKTVFTLAKSNTETIQIFHRIPTNAIPVPLLTLAHQFIDNQQKRSETDCFWHDLIKASANRYFKYGDRSSYIQAIGKLAGILLLSEADSKEVDAYRHYGTHKVPLGESSSMKNLRILVQKIGAIDEPVLILGPTGSGKELVAWNLHEACNRSGPFVPVNCAILSTNTDLAHDRLFGHSKGSFTGAIAHQVGAFEEADGGTLFLDEVAELPLPVQTQLLRVLEEGTITPLGTLKSRSVNVRIVAATHQNIPLLIREKLFRSDLYYRFNVLQIKVPPLKDRLEDMKSIANNLLYELKKKGYTYTLTQEDWHAAYNYNWPGNIRQFINLLKRAVYMKISFQKIVQEEMRADQDEVDVANVEPATNRLVFQPISRSEVLPVSDIQVSYGQYVLQLFDGNWSQASQALKISVNTLRKWLSKK